MNDIRGAVDYLKRVKPESFSEIVTHSNQSVLVENLEIDGQAYQQMYDTQTGQLITHYSVSNEKQ